MKIIYVFVLTTLLFCQFCKNGDKKSFDNNEAEDSLKIIQNKRSEATTHLSEVEFIEDLVIGAKDDSEEVNLYIPVDIDSDSKGNIYIFDLKDQNLKKFDANGNYEGNIGEKGEGPGEYKSVLSFEIDKRDHILIFDQFPPKIHCYRPSGEFLYTVDFKSFSEIVGPRNYIREISSYDDGRYIIGYQSRMEEDEEGYVRNFHHVFFDPKRMNIQEFYTKKQAGTDKVQNGDISVIASNLVKWDADSTNNIHIATNGIFEISRINPSGEIQLKYTLDITPTPITGETKITINSIFDRFKNKSMKPRGKSSKEKEFFQFYPVFDAISIDERDRIWIELYQPFLKGQKRDGKSFCVFSRDGIFLFETKIDHYIYPKLLFKNGYVYTLRTNDSESYEIVRYKMIE